MKDPRVSCGLIYAFLCVTWFVCAIMLKTGTGCEIVDVFNDRGAWGVTDDVGAGDAADIR